MELRRGTRLGPYEILEPLGAGGMGEVYRARDTRLERDVALKVLPEAFARDPERVGRFRREALLLASLNHPHIAAIHGLEESGALPVLVLEFVPGETLAQRIARGPLPVDEALELARQMAEGLEAAHERGIIHRDLKPANIKVTPEGQVKVLDFGLARALDPGPVPSDAGDSPTITAVATRAGALLGTAAYMSPEQARGKTADRRADIWAFGCVLYELLTGRHAFKGETVTDVLAAVMTREPEWDLLQTRAPFQVYELVRRCLRKDPRERLRDIGDARIEIADAIREPAVLAPVGKARTGRRWLMVVAAGLATVLVLVLAGLWLHRFQTPDVQLAPQGVLRQLTFDTGLTAMPAVSPDGTLMAYASDRAGHGTLDIWVQQMAGGDPIRLTQDAADDYEPAFSPDGSRIAFGSNREPRGIYVVPALGGEARLIARDGRRPRFSPDGKWIAYWLGEVLTRLYVVASGGGTPQRLAPDFFIAQYPVWSPDGRYLLFQGSPKAADPWPADPWDWWIVSPGTGEVFPTGATKTLSARLGGVDYQWGGPVGPPELWLSQPDRVIFSVLQGGAQNLWEVGFSPGTGKITGGLQSLTRGAGTNRFASAGPDERLVFSNTTANIEVWSLPLKPDSGEVTGTLERLTHDMANNTKPRLSADGERLAFSSRRPGRFEIRYKDLGTGRETALIESTLHVSRNYAVAADGSRVAYARREETQPEGSFSHSVYTVAPGGLAEKVCENCVGDNGIYHWSPDGETLLGGIGKGPPGVAAISVRDGRVIELLRHPEHALYDARFSPDSRWIAFHAEPAPVIRQLFIAPYRHGPVPEKEWIPVTDGLNSDGFCWWSPDGNLLYFISNRDGFDCIWAQPLHPSTKQAAGSAFPVHHLHWHGLWMPTWMGRGWYSVFVGSDRLVFSLQETTGNIWMLEPARKE